MGWTKNVAALGLLLLPPVVLFDKFHWPLYRSGPEWGFPGTFAAPPESKKIKSMKEEDMTPDPKMEPRMGDNGEGLAFYRKSAVPPDQASGKRRSSLSLVASFLLGESGDRPKSP